MSTMNLFMPRIEADYSAADMIDTFYVNGIATVSRVVYKPYVSKNTLYYRAYVNIHEWHDNESAYNFIKRLNFPKKETRFVYNKDNWFVVRIDPKPWLLDLAGCLVTNNHLLDTIDLHNHSGFFGLQPIDSDWEDIKALINDALDDFNAELNPEDDDFSEISENYSIGYSIEEDDQSLGYSTDDEAEAEAELRRADFEQEAEDWYDDYMEIKLSMSPSEFRDWEFSRIGKRTKKECQYEHYLRTGYAVY